MKEFSLPLAAADAARFITAPGLQTAPILDYDRCHALRPFDVGCQRRH
jgi:hypothetical protein